MPEDGEPGGPRIFTALFGIADLIGELEDPDAILEVIVRGTPRLRGVRRCAILLRDPRRREFRVSQVGPSDRERNGLLQRVVRSEEDILKLAHGVLEPKLPACALLTVNRTVAETVPESRQTRPSPSTSPLPRASRPERTAADGSRRA